MDVNINFHGAHTHVYALRKICALEKYHQRKRPHRVARVCATCHTVLLIGYMSESVAPSFSATPFGYGMVLAHCMRYSEQMRLCVHVSLSFSINSTIIQR